MSKELENNKMIREVDTNRLLPQVIGNTKEMKDLNAVLDIELESMWGYLSSLFYNRYISTADEIGISRYEKILGIYKDKNATLEERRRVVHYEWNSQVVYTERTLRNILDTLVGVDKYQLEVICDEYTVSLNLLLEDNSTIKFQDIYKALRESIPANMEIKHSYSAYDDLNLNTGFNTSGYNHILCNERLCGTVPNDLKIGGKYD